MTPKEYVFNDSPNKNMAKGFIQLHHYTHSCPNVYKCFTLEDNNQIIGVCIFSYPSRQSITVPNANRLLELSRLYIIDGTPKNTESYFIGKCLKWLKDHDNFDAVVSFADPTEGHHGTIYKATNFVLLGQTEKNYHYINSNNERIHKRQVWDRAKANNLKESEQATAENLTKIEELCKHKYVYYLRPRKKRNIVYALIDPCSQQIRYIGKTEQGEQRLVEHLKPSGLKDNNRKINWLKSLLAQGLQPEFYILEVFDDPTHLFEAEEFWYQYFKMIGCDLTNSTECGKGTRGYKHKPSTLKILSEKRIGVNKGKPLAVGCHVRKPTKLINDIEHKECYACLEYLPLDSFTKRKTTQLTIAYCKKCFAGYQREWRKEHPSPKLSKEEYRASRRAGGRAGGMAIANSPEARNNLSKKLSKAVIGTHTVTGVILRFPSALKAKEHGFNNANLGQAIKYNKPYKGYTWKFDL